MNQIQDTLDSMKDQKFPSITPFGLPGLIKGARHWVDTSTGDNPFGGDYKGPRMMHVVDRFPGYVRLISSLTTAKELLAELEKALEGQE